MTQPTATLTCFATPRCKFSIAHGCNKTGCGIHTKLGERVIYNGNFYLGDTTTVFQAEVTGIKKSAEMLIKKQMDDQTITFFSDSQASLAALDKRTVKSDTGHTGQ